MTVGEVARLWLERGTGQKGRWAPSTLEGYERHVRRHIEASTDPTQKPIGTVKLRDLTIDRVAAWSQANECALAPRPPSSRSSPSARCAATPSAAAGSPRTPFASSKPRKSRTGRRRRPPASNPTNSPASRPRRSLPAAVRAARLHRPADRRSARPHLGRHRPPSRTDPRPPTTRTRPQTRPLEDPRRQARSRPRTRAQQEPPRALARLHLQAANRLRLRHPRRPRPRLPRRRQRLPSSGSTQPNSRHQGSSPSTPSATATPRS